jgi:hypothetical protein
MNTGKLRNDLRRIRNDFQVITNIEEMRGNATTLINGLSIALDAIDIYKEEIERLRGNQDAKLRPDKKG